MIGQTGDILGHNMYAYTQNNPVMMVDPNGYSPLSWLEDRWNDIKDAWNYWYIPDEKYYVPSSGEVAKTFIYSILGIADESIIKVLDGVIERGYQNIGYTDITGLRFVFKTANFGLKGYIKDLNWILNNYYTEKQKCITLIKKRISRILKRKNYIKFKEVL